MVTALSKWAALVGNLLGKVLYFFAECEYSDLSCYLSLGLKKPWPLCFPV